MKISKSIKPLFKCKKKKKLGVENDAAKGTNLLQNPTLAFWLSPTALCFPAKMQLQSRKSISLGVSAGGTSVCPAPGPH